MVVLTFTSKPYSDSDDMTIVMIWPRPGLVCILVEYIMTEIWQHTSRLWGDCNYCPRLEF